MKIRIQFTDQDIANGKLGSVQESPLALAFRRWVERDGDVLTHLNITHCIFIWQVQGQRKMHMHRAMVPRKHQQAFFKAMFGKYEEVIYEWDSEEKPKDV